MIDAPSAVTTRNHEVDGPVALVVCRQPLDERSVLGRAATAMANAGWELGVAAPSRPRGPEDGGMGWYPTGPGPAAARRVRQLGAQADVVCTDAATLPLVRRAKPRAPVVLLVEDELLGRHAKALRDARLD